MAGEVEAEMGILTKVVQAKDTLVTHGAAGCLQASPPPRTRWLELVQIQRF